MKFDYFYLFISICLVIVFFRYKKYSENFVTFQHPLMTIGKKVRLKFRHNGKYMKAQKDGNIVQGDSAGEWETFTVTDAGNGKIRLKTWRNNYIRALGNGNIGQGGVGSEEIFDVIRAKYGHIYLKTWRNTYIRGIGGNNNVIQGGQGEEEIIVPEDPNVIVIPPISRPQGLKISDISISTDDVDIDTKMDNYVQEHATECTEGGGEEIHKLEPHILDCGPGHVLREFKFNRCPVLEDGDDQNDFAFDYKCIPINGEYDWGDWKETSKRDDDKLDDLTWHYPSCGIKNNRRGMINWLQLVNKSGNSWYKYRCLHPHSSTGSHQTIHGSCEYTKGRNLEYLDRHDVSTNDKTRGIYAFRMEPYCGSGNSRSDSSNNRRYKIESYVANDKMED